MSLEAVIFDVDGTLADTERDGHRLAFNKAFADAGLDWHWDVECYGKLLAITGGKERIRHYVEQYVPASLPEPGRAAAIAAIHQAKTRYFVDLLAQGGIPLRPGVARLIQELKASGVRMAIATTTTPQNVTALLTATLGEESLAWFEVIGAGDVVPHKKPAPDIYLWVLEQMQLQPSQCIALEDSDNGLKAALQAGITSIVTVSGYTHHQDFEGAKLVLSDLGEATHPFRGISGDTGGHHYVDAALLRQLHRSSDMGLSA